MTAPRPRLPYMKRPCRDCPFRTDAPRGWLGTSRAREILAADSFVCHKKRVMQCAGHMLLRGERNAFVRAANGLGIELDLCGHEVVFESDARWLAHHGNQRGA